MKFVRSCFTAVAFLAAMVSSAAAQVSLADLQSKMAGSWLVIVEGQARTRTLEISSVAQKSEGVYSFSGNFGFSDGRLNPVGNGEIRPSGQDIAISFVTSNEVSVSASGKVDGGLTGTFAPQGVPPRPVKLTKGGAAAASAVVTEFDGRWTGNASASSGCAGGQYDLTVKDGKITGTANFYGSSGMLTSTVTGQVLPDKTAFLRLQGARSNRFQGSFENNQFKASDPAPAGGSCSYEVRLKKGG